MQQMTLEVLISCMHQSDWSIIQRSNIQTDVLIINQCDRDAVEEYSFPNQLGKICHARMIHTTTRGLSRSRNMALRYATGDICVFCDDDEIFESDYEQTILNAFQTHVDFTIIAFKLNYDRKKCPTKTRTYNRFTSGSLSSAQIAFRRQDIIATSILFDEKMGSGTGNGGGEECKWMYQLLSKREVKAMYVPMLIATVQSGNRYKRTFQQGNYLYLKNLNNLCQIIFQFERSKKFFLVLVKSDNLSNEQLCLKFYRCLI